MLSDKKNRKVSKKCIKNFVYYPFNMLRVQGLTLIPPPLSFSI